MFPFHPEVVWSTTAHSQFWLSGLHDFADLFRSLEVMHFCKIRTWKRLGIWRVLNRGLKTKLLRSERSPSELAGPDCLCGYSCKNFIKILNFHSTKLRQLDGKTVMNQKLSHCNQKSFDFSSRFLKSNSFCCDTADKIAKFVLNNIHFYKKMIVIHFFDDFIKKGLILIT